jgi:hypothetical protein
MSRSFAVLLVLGAVAAGSCSLERLRRDEAAKAQTGLLAGRVAAPPGATGAVITTLFKLDRDGPKLVSYDERTDLVRSFAFLVEAGQRYVVIAFQDLDGDRRWEPGEPLGVVRAAAAISVGARGVLTVPETALTAGAAPPPGYDLDPGKVPAAPGGDVPLALGDVAPLDDPRFDPARGEEGMWTSLAALRASGYGVYFLEPYDPARTPVLFVHGIAGSPRDFTDAVASLDRTRFQAWVFQYPSGLRLGLSAEVLGRSLRRLHESFAFRTMAVVAHSMGGLVARGALQWADGQPGGVSFVSLLVSFATPWLGHEAAAAGLKWLEAPVPAWIDMTPESDYLRSLRRPLPAGVAYYLLFGFGGGRSVMMGEANDGVVTVASELAPFAQADAVRIWGYDLDHMAILSDPAPLARLGAILGAVEPGAGE